MTITRIIGDKHGLWNEYLTVIAGCDKSVQVGDFGIGFSGDYWHDRVNDTIGGTGHRFIRGNHDDAKKCKKDMLSYIPDGTVENDIMYVGGAWSIDRDHRTPGINWWGDEQLSKPELKQMYDIYIHTKPRVMITHDCPTLAAYYMFFRSGLITYGGNTMFLTDTAEAFQKMFEAHRPEFWFFGHWHHSVSATYNGTTFLCLDELDYIDLNLDDSNSIRDAIKNKFNGK